MGLQWIKSKHLVYSMAFETFHLICLFGTERHMRSVHIFSIVHWRRSTRSTSSYHGCGDHSSSTGHSPGRSLPSFVLVNAYICGKVYLSCVNSVTDKLSVIIMSVISGNQFQNRQNPTNHRENSTHTHTHNEWDVIKTRGRMNSSQCSSIIYVNYFGSVTICLPILIKTIVEKY